VTLHVAYVHAFVNPSLFVVLHRGLRHAALDVCCWWWRCELLWLPPEPPPPVTAAPTTTQTVRPLQQLQPGTAPVVVTQPTRHTVQVNDRILVSQIGTTNCDYQTV
jgi:hypothetical protein